MKYRLPLILFLGIICQAYLSYGQIGVNSYQLTPGSSDILSHVDQPVSLSNGTVNIDIPLGTIGTANVKVPVSISYQTAGILVPRCASSIGTGWNLNGARVTRVVRGLPDDQGLSVAVLPWLYETHTGRFYNQKATEVNNFSGLGADSDIISGITSIKDVAKPGGSYSYTTQSAAYMMASGDNDTEPDEFYFSFGEKQGKFVFDVNQGVLSLALIPYQNIKIDCDFDAYGKIVDFFIYDDDGTKYLFSTTEQVTDSTFSTDDRNLQLYNGPVAVSKSSITYTQSWHLTKITDVDGDEINFTYADESFLDLSIQNAIYRGDNQNARSFSKIISPASKRLSSITTKNAEVDFWADSVRRDVMGGNARAITDISFWQKNVIIGAGAFGPKLTKRFHFNYDYFQSPTTDTFDAVYQQLEVSLTAQEKATFYKRLKLNSIQQFGTTAYAQQYLFTYNTNHQLPYRFSRAVDFWNFYNGESTNTSLVPTIYGYPSLTGSDRFRIFPKLNYTPTDSFLKTGANRHPGNDDIMSTGMLTSVKYPTGGSTVYEYESDEYNYDGTNYRGSGLRIKSIKSYDGVSVNPTNIKSYTYQIGNTGNSSGKIISMPVFAFPMDATTDLSLADRCNNSQVQGGNLNGKNVGYTEVVEFFGTSSGKAVYKFSMPATAGDTDDVSGDGLYHATLSHAVLQPKMLFNGVWVTDTLFTLASRGIQLTNNTYPFAPNPDYDWNRGLLLSKTDYDNNDIPVHKIENNYAIWFKNTSPTYIFGFLKAFCNINNQYILPDNTPSAPYAYWIFYAKYYLIADCAKTLVSAKETYYDHGDTSKSVITTQNYVYGPNHTFPLGQSTIKNNTRKAITTYKYIPDLNYANVPAGALSESQAYRALFLKNRIANPIQTSFYKEINSVRYLTGSNLQTYSFSNNKPRIKKSFEMDLPGVSTSAPDLSIDNSGILLADSRYTERFSYDQYSADGSLLQITSDQSEGSFIYDFYNSLVTAKITNAKSNEVAYCSFENATYSSDSDENFGNWKIDNYNNMVNPGFTGSMAYMLNTGGGATNPTKIQLDSTSGKKYIISFWKKDNSGDIWFNNGSQTLAYSTTGPSINGWTYYETVFTPVSGGVSFWKGWGATIIDDLRLYPANAQMETTTYNPSVGVTAKCDTRNNVVFYEYDFMGRVSLVKDIHGNIIKKLDYAVQQSE